MSDSKPSLKDQILSLREEGFSYNAIKSKLGCTISTISYHCSEDVSKLAKSRVRKHRATKKGKCKESFARLGLEYVKIPQKDLQIKNPSNAKKATTRGVKCLHLREVLPQKIGKEVLEK